MKQEYQVRKMLKKVKMYIGRCSNPIFVKNLRVVKKTLKWVLKNE